MGILRRIVQVIATLLVNSAFIFGQTSPADIYQGGLKKICSPGLNCYACPYAVVACPIGSIQHFIASARYHFSFYVGGFLLLTGAIFGRLICGWICPFGLFQDVVFKIKTPKIKLPPSLRRLRWVALIGLVILLPLITGDQAYCRYLCPAGTLEAGVPFAFFSSQVRDLIGSLYFFKVAILIFFAAGSVLIFRFFCRTACPLGLIYGFFNRFSLLGFTFDKDRCIDCGLCAEICPVDLKPAEEEFLDNACIRCLKCRDICPVNCFQFGLKFTADRRRRKNGESIFS